MTEDHYEKVKNEWKSMMKKTTKIDVSYKKEIPFDTQLKSHFGGQPYFEKGETWPRATNGNPLRFVFQIFHEKDVELPENVKLVQYFYDYDYRSYEYTDDDPWLVKVYETVNLENRIIIKEPKRYIHFKWYDENPKWANDDEENYGEIEFTSRWSLPDWEIYSMPMEKKYWNILEELDVEDETCSRAGGHPRWLQGEMKKDGFDFLFQIRADEVGLGQIWGDIGTGYFFYNSSKKEPLFYYQNT
jgi:uncharacterized protein YwqG